MDHYLQIAGMGVGDADAPMLEGYTTLAFLAAHTSTVELQLLVTGVTYRHPGLLAKIVSRAGTTNLPRRSTHPGRSRGRTHRS